ncbi:MAG: 5-formyltetrahydrofolate cyclo-ligase [Ruminococcaceae bacterium]|nr:5-formyltetrahydrofolate cyclo-ligase [Oscillospiraceae bacterium]
MYQIKEEKKALREEYSKKRSEMDLEHKKSLDKKIIERFKALATYRYSHTLLLYYPIQGEIDVTGLINDALRSGKRVALPRCESHGSVMHFHYINSIDDLKIGRFGIMEPREDAELFSKDSLGGPTVVVIPALSYDRLGYRLGYGRGFYDRYFGRSGISTVGLVYSEFLTDKLPHGRFDIAVDILITEKEVKVIGK